MQNNCKGSCIKCDVMRCKHNQEGSYCKLDSIKVTCGCGGSCTQCDDYSEIE